MIIAGIGSRETPEDILDQMTEIGAICRERKIFVRSGHAPGADQAFEFGAREYCIAYIPWKGFEGDTVTLGTKYIIPPDLEKLTHYAKQFHPAWEKLSPGAQKLMARNSCQVLGQNLESPADLIVCWTKDGQATGGTGQALRIAEKNNIPILNLYNRTIEDVINQLQEK